MQMFWRNFGRNRQLAQLDYSLPGLVLAGVGYDVLRRQLPIHSYFRLSIFKTAFSCDQDFNTSSVIFHGRLRIGPATWQTGCNSKATTFGFHTQNTLHAKLP